MNNKLLLQVKDLGYQHQGVIKQLFSEVSFQVHAGELLCLAGNNGSGKTSLLYILQGLLQQTQGEIIWSSSKNKVGTQQRIQKVSLVLQDPESQIIGSTVAEDIELSLRLYPKEKQKDLLEKTQALFTLSSYWDTPIHTLSYGQKRKLTLATAFLTNPELLLLDEPLSGLDYTGVLEFVNLLKIFLAQETAIILSTHDLAPFVPLMQSLLYLEQGKAIHIPDIQNSWDCLKNFAIRPLHL